MKIFSCLSWIQHLCNQVYELFVPNTPVVQDLDEVTDRELPYELIVDILSRLPADCVVPCVHACKPLLDLTRTQSFVSLHLKRASPVIAFQYFVPDEEEEINKYAREVSEVSVNFIDKTLQKVANTKTLTIDLRLGIHMKERRLTLYGSYNGFLMFKNIIYDAVLFIWNPATQEQVTIVAPHDGYHAIGLFFHPTSKEHRVLFVSSAKDRTHFEYSILSLKTKSSRLVTRSKYQPSSLRPPVIVNGTLHWMICDGNYSECCTNSIVLFNMKTEEVSTMWHPGSGCQSIFLRTVHMLMKLLEKDGKLWFVNDAEEYGNISMWMLEEGERTVWVRMHYIELKIPSTPFCCFLKNCKRHKYPKVMHIFKDEVLIRVFSEDLYLYSLQAGDGSDKMRIVGKYLSISGRPGRPVTAFSHVGTLLSLHTDKLLFLFDDRTK